MRSRQDAGAWICARPGLTELMRLDAFRDILGMGVMSNAMRGYEEPAHLYDIFDTKENVEFFIRYGARKVS